MLSFNSYTTFTNFYSNFYGGNRFGLITLNFQRFSKMFSNSYPMGFYSFVSKLSETYSQI